MFAAAIPAAIAAGASIWGQNSANETNRSIANNANAQTAYQAQLNRDWQERMSNTSWQRGVADMKAAGINPMLAFSKGGASTPAGSAATAQTGAPQQNTMAGVTSALQLLNLKAQIDNIKAQTENTRAQTAATVASTPEKQFRGNVYTDVNKGYSSAKQFISSGVSNLKSKINNARSHSIAPRTWDPHLSF